MSWYGASHVESVQPHSPSLLCICHVKLFPSYFFFKRSVLQVLLTPGCPERYQSFKWQLAHDTYYLHRHYHLVLLQLLFVITLLNTIVIIITSIMHFITIIRVANVTITLRFREN